MKILWYCVCALAIIQIADFTTWLLKKTVGKKRKGEAKEEEKLDEVKETGKAGETEKVIELKKEDPFWKKVKWGIAAAVLVLVLALKQSESVCDWIAAHNLSNGSLGLFEAMIFYLGGLKFLRSVVYDLRLYAWREIGHLPTEKETFGLCAGLTVGGVILALISLCGWLGMEYFLLFFVALVVFALIAWITSPIVLKIIKK